MLDASERKEYIKISYIDHWALGIVYFSRGNIAYAHLEKSTDSTKAFVPLGCPTSVSCVVADEDSMDDRWEVCSLVLVKNVATLVRRRLLKLSRTLLLGRDSSEG